MSRSNLYLFIGGLSLVILVASRPKGNIDELSQKIISLLNSYVEEIPEEKVFVHLDKSYYAAGEDIWFSVYLTAGSPDILSPLSKTVYVDLLDNSGKLIEQRTVKIREGHGYGDFKLPYFIPEGLYHIKAYSTWIRGFGEEQVFSSAIEILEPLNLNFQPQVSFSFGEGAEEGDISYVGNILALDKNLQPKKDKKIKYQLMTSTHILGEGDLSLDSQGSVKLEVVLKESDLNKAVFLKLIYQENKDFQIIRQFRFPFPDSVIDLQFMPEGGEIIEGFANKVAFRAVYPDGTPAEVKGELRGPEGYIESFEANVNGLGYLTFTPNGNDYKAYLLTDNKDLPLTFPNIQSKGINLTIDNSKKELLNMLIQAKDYLLLDAKTEGLLVVHARGRIGHMQKLDLTSGVAGARISKNQLPPGINQVTIFNGSGQPLAERLVFIEFEDAPNINIKAENLDIRAKGKNSIYLQMDAEIFEGGNYSVSITDASGPSDDKTANILTYLKFSSELKGSISDKDLYTDGKLDADAVDLIMLTNGWRRFNWDKVFQAEYQNTAHIEQGINVMGMIKPKYKSRKGLEGGTLNVLQGVTGEEFIVSEFSDNGRFVLDALDFQDTTTLVLSAEDGRQKRMLEISIDKPLSTTLKWEDFEPMYRSQVISPALREYLETAQEKRKSELYLTGEDEIIMEEFVVRGNQIVDPEDGITRIYGKGDKIFRAADYDDAHHNHTIAHFIRGRLPGVTVKPNPENPMSLMFKIQGVFAPPPQAPPQPLLFVDNQEVDAEEFSAIRPTDVLTVEVFYGGVSNARFGSISDGGVIAVYTKSGGGFYQSEGVLHTKYPGYSTAREFYVPKYDEESMSKPDLRSTLYWNPLVKFEGRKAEIEFQNNDITEKFKVVVQGMDKFGRVSYAEKIIE